MAEAQKKEEGKESVDSILGKIKNIVTGKEKVTVEEDSKQVSAVDDEEPMELTEVVESSDKPADTGADISVLETIAESLKHLDPNEQAAEQPRVEEAAAANAAEEEKFVDVLQEIDQALDQQPAAPEANANVAQPVQNEPVLAPEPKKQLAEENSQNIISSQVKPDMAEEKSEKILSEEIAAKSSKAIQSLLNNIPRPDINSPAFRSAITLEDIVHETMKPLLKEWLDQNLEVIVRDIVEREIKKIMPRE